MHPDCEPTAAEQTTDLLVAFIRSQPGMADRLIANHANDGTGRCRTCSTGAQAGRYRWPCALYCCATQA